MKILAKGLFGMATPFVALVVSYLPTVEAWLRIGALLGSIGVAILTCISLYKRGNK